MKIINNYYKKKYIKIYFCILFLILFLIIFYFVYSIYSKPNITKNLKNATIISNIGEPYLMEDKLSPMQITLTSDQEGENGGLSYLKNYTNDLNIEFIKDYFKHNNIYLPKDTKIIYGAGTTMMISSMYYALQKKLNHPINITTNLDVFYMLHKKLANIAKNVEWINNNNKYSNKAELSVIVSPSNPLGIITHPKDVHTKYMLYDIVYDKLSFTGKDTSVNIGLFEEFAMNKNIFITTSFSKLGIAGVRFGFLITRDDQIAEYCNEYINIVSVRTPTASATIGRLCYYRYFKNKSFYINIYNIIQNRKKIFIKYAKKYNIKIINNITIIPYIYTNKSTEWWLKNLNTETRKGSDFNDIDAHSRFNLMISEDKWSEFVRRFELL